MTDETEAEFSVEFAQELLGFASTASQVSDGHEVAKAFLTVGVQVSMHTHGPEDTADWLHGIADSLAKTN